jgi:hypothetical protein
LVFKHLKKLKEGKYLEEADLKHIVDLLFTEERNQGKSTAKGYQSEK